MPAMTACCFGNLVSRDKKRRERKEKGRSKNLGNELNLLANLAPPWCGDKQCFNTAEMVNFTSALATIIRAGDPKGRPITSGFAAPRPQAWHQEHCNLTDPHCDYWGLDTEEQFREMLAAEHQGMEVIEFSFFFFWNNLSCKI